MRIASATLSGFRPPEAITGTPPVSSSISAQSHVAPVPPGATAEPESSRWKSVWNERSPRRSAWVRTLTALITLQPVRRATSAQ